MLAPVVSWRRGDTQVVAVRSPGLSWFGEKRWLGVWSVRTSEGPVDHRCMEQWMLPGVSLITQATLPAYSD